MARIDNMSIEEGEAMRARQLAKCGKARSRTEAVDIPDEGKEAILLSKIVKYCETWGWKCLPLCTSKKAKGFLLPGWPDLTIAITRGRTIYIELKSKDGRLRKEQDEMQIHMMGLGQKYYIVRSFKRFLEIIEELENVRSPGC